MKAKLISLDKQIRKLESKRDELLQSSYYCLECARFYDSNKVKTWIDYDDTVSLTVRCPLGHVWEER